MEAFKRRALLVGAGIAALVSVVLLLWKVPAWEVAPLRKMYFEKDVFEAEDRVRATLAQILGGAFVLAGLGFTWWRIEVARQGKSPTDLREPSNS
jgi:hypothetical protein